MHESHTQVSIEIVDNRGNVVVAIDHGARLAGTLRRIPDVLAFGTRLDVMLVIGDEPAALAVRVMGSADVVAGVVVGAVVLQFDVGGLDLVPRPTVAVSNSSSDGIGLSGDISDVPMAELVQLLCATRRTAEVELRHLGRFLGTLAFADGRAVSARTVDDVVGVEAFYALAGLEVGAFAVRYNRRAGDENLTSDTLFLLLESARRADEARRVEDDQEQEQEQEHAAERELEFDEGDDRDQATQLSGPALPSTPLTPPVAAVSPSRKPPPLPKKQSTTPVPAVASSSSSSSSSSSGKRRSSDRPITRERTIESPRQTAASIGQFSGFFSEFSVARAHQKSQEGVAANSQEGAAVQPEDVVDEQPAPPVATGSLKPDFGDMMDKDTDIIGREAATVAAE